MEITALTSVTATPVATQGWVYPLSTGASGIDAPMSTATIKVSFSAGTISGTAADSKFLVLNTSRGEFAAVIWTKADAQDEDTGTLQVVKNDELAVVQVTEDGTTEFADCNISITLM